MNRIEPFLSSVFSIFLIAALIIVYLKIVLKLVNFEKIGDFKSALIFLFPIKCVLFPAIEELIFRAPIIIIFDSISFLSASSIIISSGLFSLMHFFDFDEKTSYTKRLLRTSLAFIFGSTIGFVAIKFQSIWIGFIAHISWNILIYLNVYFFLPALYVFVSFSLSGISKIRLLENKHYPNPHS